MRAHVCMFSRCVAENLGDVAFVKHTTVFDNMQGESDPVSQSNPTQPVCLYGNKCVCVVRITNAITVPVSRLGTQIGCEGVEN